MFESASDCCLLSDEKFLSWIFIVLVHWKNSPQIDTLLHSNILFWFKANQPLLWLLIDNCLAKSNKYQCSSLWFYQTMARTHNLLHSKLEH